MCDATVKDVEKLEYSFPSTTYELPLIGAEYIHKKGNKYIVVGFAHHTETNERLVIYSHINHPNTLWARPVDIFMDGRFTLVEV